MLQVIWKSILIFTCCPLMLLAQEKKFLSPDIKISAEYLLKENLKDTPGTFQNKKAQLSFNVPIYSRRYGLTNELEYRTIIVQLSGGGSYAMPEFSFISPSHQLINGSLGLRTVWSSGSKNTWLLNFSGTAAEDNYTILTPVPRFSGAAMLKHKVSGDFSYSVGMAYSFSYGRGLPLPLLGAEIAVTKKGKLKIILPVHLSFRYKLNEWDIITLSIHPEGGLNNFANKGDSLFSGYPDKFTFRIRGFKAGIDMNIFVNDNMRFIPEAGWLTGRKISFSDQGDASAENFYSQPVDPTPYIKLSFRYIFGDQKWKRTGNNILFNDDRLEDYDMDDPTKL